jgi:hypothetical protein
MATPYLLKERSKEGDRGSGIQRADPLHNFILCQYTDDLTTPGTATFPKPGIEQPKEGMEAGSGGYRGEWIPIEGVLIHSTGWTQSAYGINRCGSEFGG